MTNRATDRFFTLAKQGASGATVADLLKAASGPGPCASELVSLADLAALLIQAPGGESLTPTASERELLSALLGDGDWADRAPSRLAVFCPWGTGFLELDDEVHSFTWAAGASLRANELRWLWSRHLEGTRLADIEASPSLKAQGLAVLRAPALAAFSITALGDWPARQTGAVLPAGLPASLNGRRPGDPWSDAQRADLLAHVQALKNAAPTLKSEAMLDGLGEVLSCSASNLKQQLAKARKLAYGEASKPLHRAA